MKVVKWMAIVAAVLLAVFFGGALLIDPAYRVERVAVINAPAPKVYALISDPKAWVKWTVWNQREPNMKMGFSGAASGQGAKWEWESKDGHGNMEFTGAEPDRQIRYRLGFVEMSMVSTGALTLTPEGNGTRISWTNEGNVGNSPMMRWFVPFMDKMMGPDFEGGLTNLKALAEKT